jgi:hypothetical protein
LKKKKKPEVPPMFYRTWYLIANCGEQLDQYLSTARKIAVTLYSVQKLFTNLSHNAVQNKFFLPVICFSRDALWK